MNDSYSMLNSLHLLGRPFIPPCDLNRILMIAHPSPADFLPFRRSLLSSAGRLHRGRRAHHPVETPPALPAESGGGLDLLSSSLTEGAFFCLLLEYNCGLLTLSNALKLQVCSLDQATLIRGKQGDFC